MSYFIDTHAHIYAEQFKEDREIVLEHTFEQGVDKIFMPNIDHSSIEAMLELEEQYPQKCFAMMGLHPCYVKKGFEKELYKVEDWLAKRKFVAVGEIGIDLYWDKALFEEQKEAFRIQVELAKKYDLPIVIHCRESFSETVEIVEKLKDESLKGIFHCFTGDTDDAKKVIDLDFLMGIGGVVTFKNAGLDKTVAEIDLAHLVLETDSPYLAPKPHRGKRNAPSYIPLIAEKVAEVKSTSLEEVRSLTTKNALKVFKVNKM